MSELRRAAVVGLGLVGGSLARDLAAHGVQVSAYDENPERLDAAVRDKVVTERMDAALGGGAYARPISS